jgi:hypothetical protein
MIRLAFHFVWSMARHQWAKWRGYQILASSARQAQRAAICDPCADNEDGQCTRCHCLIMSKTMLNLEGCPRKLWRPVWEKKAEPSRS